MIELFRDADGFTHTIAGLVLLGRLGDIGSTRLITPTLRLEANPVVRRLGWWFAWSTLLVAAIPYFSPQIGVAVLAASLMVTASNLSRGWVFRALGEAESEEFMLRIAARSRRGTALAFLLAGTLFVILAGVVLMWLSGSIRYASFWFAVGLVIYGLALGIHGSAYIVRLFRRARAMTPVA